MVDPFPHAVLILQNPSPTFINFGFMSCCFPGSTAIMLGYQGSDSENAYDFLNFFFFQSDRPTRYQETHSTVNKKKKKRGWPNMFFIQNGSVSCSLSLFLHSSHLTFVAKRFVSFGSYWLVTTSLDF